MDELKVCVGYEVGGEHREHFPAFDLDEVKPIYREVPGFDEDITAVRRFEDLPENARRYVSRVETLVGVPVELISIGPGRDETIARNEPFRRA